MVAAGTVDDYDAAKKSDLKQKFATEAGVTASEVEVTVTAASVKISVVINAASQAASNSLKSTLDTVLADADAASSFTGVTIEQAPVIATQTQAPDGSVTVVDQNQETPDEPDNSGTVVVAVVVPIVCLLLIGVLIGVFVKTKTAKQPTAKMGAATPTQMRTAETEMGDGGITMVKHDVDAVSSTNDSKV